MIIVGIKHAIYELAADFVDFSFLFIKVKCLKMYNKCVRKSKE